MAYNAVSPRLQYGLQYCNHPSQPGMTRQSVQRPCRDRLAQGQVFYAVGTIFGLARFGNQFQVPDALPNGDLDLMRIDDASESFPTLLPFCCFP
jgi:hypothetical protein